MKKQVNLRFILLLLFGIGLGAAALAVFYPAPQSTTNEPLVAEDGGAINGIRFSDYKGFEENWKLAIVTYRQDVSEMRFSYANDLAYETLLKNSLDYPDGAVFIKAAMVTSDDPSFINSKRPTTVHRYQVMKRDAEKYKETGGWGFAYFDATGWGNKIISWNERLVPDNVFEHMSENCFVCHTMVKDRNYVFSQLTDTTPYNNRQPQFPTKILTTSVPGVTFTTITRDSVPEFIRQFVPAEAPELRRVAGAMGARAFIGIAYELRPTLIAEAARTTMPVTFFNEQGGAMIVVAPADPTKEVPAPQCRGEKKLFVSYWVVGDGDGNWPTKNLFCYGPEAELPKSPTKP